MLVELAPYGNLRDFLMDRRPNAIRKSVDLPMSELSTHHLVSFGLQVAQGMDYLTRLNVSLRLDNLKLPKFFIQYLLGVI